MAGASFFHFNRIACNFILRLGLVSMVHLNVLIASFLKTRILWGFPGGTVVKNLPANAGDTGSSPDPGKSHIPRSNKARAPQLLSLRSRTRAPQQEKSLQ